MERSFTYGISLTRSGVEHFAPAGAVILGDGRNFMRCDLCLLVIGTISLKIVIRTWSFLLLFPGHEKKHFTVLLFHHKPVPHYELKAKRLTSNAGNPSN